MESLSPLPELRAWQQEALDRWLPRRRGVASVVTGAGKTTFALACISRMRIEVPDLRVLIVVPTIALLDQWMVELETSLALPRTDIAAHGGGAKPAITGAVHVSVVNTARTLTSQLATSGPWMLVADECHRYGAPANRSAVRGEWAAALGLSATPTREYDDWFEQYVVPETGPIFYEYSYEDALADRVLTPFVLTNFKVPMSGKERAAVERANMHIARLVSRHPNTDQEALKQALIRRSRLFQSVRSRLPAARELMKSRRGVRALIFHEQIVAANELVSLLREDGHRVVAYHSGLSSPARQKNLLLFRTHQVDVLVTCRALDEGLDVPDAQFGLICASTASTRQRIQRLGRLVRRAEGKVEAEVATIYAGDAEASRLRSEEEQMSGLARVRWFSVEFR
jgi:superfamily II DNA or RNA helicase